MPKVDEEYYKKKRKEIIEAAYRVCTRKPIASVVMNDIIAETGFSHGVIYKYYGDLDEVLRDLVAAINSENKIDEKLDVILNQGDSRDWKKTVRDICMALAEQMLNTGIEVLKISLYSDMLAMSDPERVRRIADNVGEAGQSPLFKLVFKMTEFLNSVIDREALQPVKSVEEIIEFMIVTYHGIQTGYVLSECYDAEHMRGKYKPPEMFSCLAESIILMLGGEK